MDNALQTLSDLAPAVSRQCTVFGWDMMEQEDQVENNRRDQFQDGKHPNDQREEHTEQNYSLKIVIFSQDLDIVEELRGARAAVIFCCVFAAREKIHLHDRVECNCIDDLTGAICKDSVHPELERKVCIESDIFGCFTILGQLCKDKESSPSTALFAQAETLDTNGKRVKEAASNTAGAHSTKGMDPSVDQDNEGSDNARGKDPSRDIERNCWLNASSPSRKGEQIDCGEDVDTIDSERDDEEDP